jgi:hypothetical protein
MRTLAFAKASARQASRRVLASRCLLAGPFKGIKGFSLFIIFRFVDNLGFLRDIGHSLAQTDKQS